MRFYLLPGIFLLTMLGARAQEPADALRYSWLTPSGTARSQATGGAMVSLGGDLTATFVNPAGIALYKTNELVLTPGFSFDNNKASYLGSKETKSASEFNYGATGFVFATPGSRNGSWRNFSFSLGLNRVADFNNKFYYNGTNNQSSFSEKYLEELIRNNVTDPNEAANDYPYGASLAFNTYLIDTIQDVNGSVAGYRSQATPQTGVIQEQTTTTNGGITDFALGGSANLQDKLFMGASIGFSWLDYEQQTLYKESDATGDKNNNFNYFTTEEYLRTKGLGINLKLGLIYKPVEYVRLGFAIHTPTLYDLEDRYSTTITTDLEGYAGQGTLTQSSRDFNDGMNGEYAYRFTNPWRFMLGVSYVFREERDVTRQRGFISADVEYVNYSDASFNTQDYYGGSDPYYDDLNETIDQIYRSAFNFRLGGELKFNTLMVRGGFAWYGNPYEDEPFPASRMNISGGLGYRDKGKFIDLTYVHQINKNGYYPYRLDQGFYTPVTVNSAAGTLLLTVGFKF
jgi:hypothetical protein